ncbi:MAG: hypothetical protein ACRYHQ_04060 [Janthinobacterium lividum]
MRMGSSLNGHRVLPAVIRPELDALLVAPQDKPHDSSASVVPIHNALATFLSTGAHLIRIAL